MDEIWWNGLVWFTGKLTPETPISNGKNTMVSCGLSLEPIQCQEYNIPTTKRLKIRTLSGDLILVAFSSAEFCLAPWEGDVEKPMDPFGGHVEA